MSTDSEAGLAFVPYAPTPLAEAWTQVRSAQGDAGERLARRFAFVEHALRLLVALLDAERARLQLPAPPGRTELINRLETPTLGHRAGAARDLARAIARAPQTVLPELVGMFAANGPATDFERAISRLVEVRNQVMHLVHGQPSEELALSCLSETRLPVRALMLGLDVLKHTPLIVQDTISDRMDGRREARLCVFQGMEPHMVEVAQHPPLPHRTPVLLTRGGVALRLDPWVAYREFGDSGLPHLRLLDRVDASGLVYVRAGVVAAGRVSGGASLPVDPAKAWLSRAAPPPPGPEPSLAGLWLRVRPQGDDVAPPRVPGYRLDRLLGRGASGLVWLARHEATGQRVALKVLHPGLVENQQQRARLTREHALMQRVRHPGVARVYDLTTDETNGPVLVMEHVDGRPLDELSAERPLDPTSAARLCAQILGALGAVHALGLVHRDVKPSNILMDQHGVPRLVDFGVARMDGLAPLTSTLDVVGTTAFAAPEQLAGEAVDGRADLYAVGRLLPTLCGGAGDWNTRLGRLPGALQCVVRRATHAQPTMRYPNAAAMQQDLQAREVAGWEGPPVGVGDVLPGGLSLTREVSALAADIWLFMAAPAGGGAPVGVLVAGGGSEGRELLKAHLARCTPEVIHQARCGGLRLASDGLAYAELRGDDPEFWAKRLLGGAPKPSEWTDAVTIGAAIGGVAVFAAGAVAALGLGVAVRDGLKKKAPPSGPAAPEAATGEPKRNPNR